MEYPATFTRDREVGGYVVSFPDVPAHTQGETMEEAMAMASEALELALTFYTDVPALSEAKFKLYAAMRAAGIKKVELARRLKCSPSQVDRLLDILHASRLDQLCG